MLQILVIDDDTFMCNLLQTYLSNHGYNVNTAYAAKDALNLIKKNIYDVVVCDFRLPDSDGLEMLKKIKSIHPATKVVIITAYAEVRMAVKLMKQGAYDYVTKPLQQEELLHLVDKIQNEDDTEKNDQNEFVAGESKEIKDVIRMCDIVAPTDMSVLIQGETGSGKEYIARLIHSKSSRNNKTFVAVDCGAIPNDVANSELFGHIKGSFTGAINDKIGVFEQANGGTLFLDEIGNLPYDLQVKLLRAIQERVITKLGSTKSIKVDVRIIAATNEELENNIHTNEFREDLYHRLNEFKVHIPALRERKVDIKIFAEFFMKQSNIDLHRNVKAIAPDAMLKLYDYPWHGNLRELRNVIKRSVLLCINDVINLTDLPDEIRDYNSEQQEFVKKITESSIKANDSNPDLKEAAQSTERELIIATLEDVNFNKTKAALKLCIDRKTLYNKMKILNIDYKALKRL